VIMQDRESQKKGERALAVDSGHDERPRGG
jgi:hypothetical protein